MPLTAGANFGPYRIIEQLGRGGMASVYRAFEPGLDRYVALKVLPPEFLHDPEFADRFGREAKVVARLEHRHIVPIYAYGIDEGIPWMAMRLVATGAASRLLEAGQIERRRAVEILAECAGALDHAHRQGVLHRDVKPQNILLDEDGHVYLADFGVAKMVESSLVFTRPGMLQGTPQYMSPEQARSEPVDHRTDIYALGIVAYEMLTGRLPFTADTPVAVLMKHVMDPIPLPPPAQVPEGMLRPLLKCLAKKREERWDTAGAFVKALEQGLEPAPQATAAGSELPTVELDVKETAGRAETPAALPPRRRQRAKPVRKVPAPDPSSSWSAPLRVRRFGRAWFVVPTVAAAAFAALMIGNLTFMPAERPVMPLDRDTPAAPASTYATPYSAPGGVGQLPGDQDPTLVVERAYDSRAADARAAEEARRQAEARQQVPQPPAVTLPPRGPAVGALVGNPPERSDITSKKTYKQGLGGAPNAGVAATMEFEVTPPDIAVGDNFTVNVWVNNTGSKELKFKGIEATARVNRAAGPKLPASLKVRDLAPGQRALIGEVTGTWAEASSWILLVVVDADKDILTNRVVFRKR